MFLSFLFALTSSVTIAIDIGTESIKTAAVDGSSPIKTKTFPAYFAIWNMTDESYIKKDEWTLQDLNNSDWLFFDEAKALLKKHPEFVVRGFTPLNGSQRGIPNKYLFVAMLQTIYLKLCSYDPLNPVIFTVPVTMSRVDRLILQECADMLAINLVAILDQHTAMAAQYMQSESAVAQRVMFLDMGAQKTWYTAFDFKEVDGSLKGRQLSQDSVEIGGDALDKQFIDKLVASSGNKNAESHKEAAQELKQMVKLGEKLEKNYEDFNVTMSPEEITIDALLPTLNAIVEKAKSLDVKEIVMTGGTSQFPLVKKFFDDVAIKTTFVQNGKVTTNAAINNGKVEGIAYYANCNTFLEYGGKKVQLTTLTTYSDEDLKFNINVADVTPFIITEDGVVLSNLTIAIPDVADPTEVVEMTFGINSFSHPNAKSALFRGFALDAYLSKVSWMIPEDKYQFASDFIGVFVEEYKGKMLELIQERERRNKMIAEMMEKEKEQEDEEEDPFFIDFEHMDHEQIRNAFNERIEAQRERVRKIKEEMEARNGKGAESTDL